MSRSIVLGALRAGVAFGWALVIAYELMAMVPNHGLQLARSERARLIFALPQGWAFFTRDPQEPVDRYYEPSAGGVRRIDEVNTSRRNLYGLLKNTRISAIEFAALTSHVAKGDWRPCSTSLAECVSGSTPEKTIVNPMLVQSVCGTLIVGRQPPVPWAWSHLKRPFYVPSQVAMVNVRCRGGKPTAGG